MRPVRIFWFIIILLIILFLLVKNSTLFIVLKYLGLLVLVFAYIVANLPIDPATVSYDAFGRYKTWKVATVTYTIIYPDRAYLLKHNFLPKYVLFLYWFYKFCNIIYRFNKSLNHLFNDSL